MVDINIQKNQGLISSIRTKLSSEGYDISTANGSIWNCIMQQVKVENEQNKQLGKQTIYSGGNDMYGDGHKNFVVDEGIVKFSQTLWDNICKLFTRKTQAEEASKIPESRETPPAYNDTTQLSEEVINTLLCENYKQVLNTTVPESYRSEVFKWLNPDNEKIVVRNEGNAGAARYDSHEGKIIINKNSLNNPNDLIKVITHEAMHAAQGSPFNTQEEELLCEMTAIRTRAALDEANNIDSGTIYGKTYAELGAMSDEELKQHLRKHFISDQTEGHFGVGAYSNRIIDKTGAITINGARGEKIPLEAGSKITVGNQEYTLGKDVFIEGIGSFAGTTCQMFKIIEGKPINIGTISFEGITQLPPETNYPQVQAHNAAITDGQYTIGNIKSGENNFEFMMVGAQI